MFKLALLAAVCLAVLQEGSALECYVCSNACDVAHATVITTCGTHASNNLEAFCHTEQRKDATKEQAEFKVRSCVLAQKGAKPECHDGFNCQDCQSDKCNAATSLFASTFTLSVVLLSCLFAKYILH